jgi:peptide deformylase
VKDEELQHLAKDIRARDATIREIADKLTETAEAAEAAASAAHTLDEQRRILCSEIERLKKAMETQMEQSMLKVNIIFCTFYYFRKFNCSELQCLIWFLGHITAKTI